MVDEPWDGLKGEVGPVLASIAPFAAMTDEARPDVWLWLPGVALLLLLRRRRRLRKEVVVRDWSETGTGTGLRGKCFRRRKNGTRLSTGRGFSVLDQHGSRPSKRPASQRGRICFSSAALVGKQPARRSVSRGNQALLEKGNTNPERTSNSTSTCTRLHLPASSCPPKVAIMYLPTAKQGSRPGRRG